MGTLSHVILFLMTCYLGNIDLAYASETTMREDSVDWHGSTEFNEAVWHYHDKSAREPQMDKEKSLLFSYLQNKIQPYMEGKGMICQVEFAGSSFQGLKVDDNNLDFDVVLVMDGTDLQAVTLEYPSHHELHAVDNRVRAKYAEYLDDHSRISGKKLAEKYYGLLAHLLNYDEELHRNVQIRKHGPAVQMDVFKAGGGTGKWFSVDLVPSFKLSSGISYVATPYKTILGDRKVQDEAMNHAWYLSFSLKENEFFQNIDQDGGCRKASVRVLKRMALDDGALKGLSSYIFKTLLFYELKEFPQKSWSPSFLGQRVMDLLGRLQDALENHRLEHYYIPGENLLRTLKNVTLENMYNRVLHLRSKEKIILKMIREKSNARRNEL